MREPTTGFTPLPGRTSAMPIVNEHAVKHTPLQPPFPEGLRRLLLGMGCFWGAERRFWSREGVYTTAVGYAGGSTPNPTYEEVCTGRTGHAEVVLVVYDPDTVTLEELLAVFWESHDPTQGMRQGNDIGTQYRSAIYVEDDGQKAVAEASRVVYEQTLVAAGLTAGITTEIGTARQLYYAEDYHQQYLAKNPNGYCGLGGTGIRFPRTAVRVAGD